MAFVQGMCPECGGMLAVDNNEKASICLFCGKAFIVKEAIEKANAVKPVVEVSNKIETVSSDDFDIENGVLKKYTGESADVVIPYGVTEIAEEAFSDCEMIVTISLPDSLHSIGDKAFSNCIRLESVVIPYGVTEIGKWAFDGCISLESIEIPEGVTEIKYGTFSGCTHLEKIILPSSLKSIGEKCFEIGSKPKKVYVNSVDAWKGIRLGNYTDSNPLYPAGKLYVNGVLITEDF